MSVMSRAGGKWYTQAVLLAAGSTLVAVTLAIGLDAWLRHEHRARSTPPTTNGAPTAAVATELATPDVVHRSAPQPLLVYVVETEDEAAFMRADLERANSTRIREGVLAYLVLARRTAGSAELLDALSREAQIVHPHGQPGVVLDRSASLGR